MIKIERPLEPKVLTNKKERWTKEYLEAVAALNAQQSPQNKKKLQTAERRYNHKEVKKNYNKCAVVNAHIVKAISHMLAMGTLNTSNRNQDIVSSVLNGTIYCWVVRFAMENNLKAINFLQKKKVAHLSIPVRNYLTIIFLLNLTPIPVPLI